MTKFKYILQFDTIINPFTRTEPKISTNCRLRIQISNYYSKTLSENESVADTILYSNNTRTEFITSQFKDQDHSFVNSLGKNFIPVPRNLMSAEESIDGCVWLTCGNYYIEPELKCFYVTERLPLPDRKGKQLIKLGNFTIFPQIVLQNQQGNELLSLHHHHELVVGELLLILTSIFVLTLAVYRLVKLIYNRKSSSSYLTVDGRVEEQVGEWLLGTTFEEQILPDGTPYFVEMACVPTPYTHKRILGDKFDARLVTRRLFNDGDTVAVAANPSIH
jgi:hypothetical protein